MYTTDILWKPLCNNSVTFSMVYTYVYLILLRNILLNIFPTWRHLWFWLQYRERVIFIGQTIDEEFSNQILATMLYLESIDDSRRLYMYINGNGGDVSSLNCLLSILVILFLVLIFFSLFDQTYLTAYSEHGHLWHNAKFKKPCLYTLCGICLWSGCISSCSWGEGSIPVS